MMTWKKNTNVLIYRCICAYVSISSSQPIFLIFQFLPLNPPLYRHLQCHHHPQNRNRPNNNLTQNLLIPNPNLTTPRSSNPSFPSHSASTRDNLSLTVVSRTPPMTIQR
ncbi:hypothetical protein V8G54_003663, partial [Vigna mungo]